MKPNEHYYGRWIIANGLGEAAGLGTTFVLGQALAPALERVSGVAAAVGTALAAIALGTVLEGVVVGIAQASVLRRALRLRPGAWVRATAVGAGAAWALGMIPTTVMSMTSAQVANGTAAAPGPLVQYGMAVLLGTVTGPILGAAQWAVLRHEVRGATAWLWANAAAWAAGMPLIFLGMDYVPWEGSAAVRIAAIYLVCGVTGLLVGAIHGRVLVRLIKKPAAPERGC